MSMLRRHHQGRTAGFDPSEHSVQEVLDYLADCSEAEEVRVLDAEAHGKNRKGLLRDIREDD